MKDNSAAASVIFLLTDRSQASSKSPKAVQRVTSQKSGPRGPPTLLVFSIFHLKFIISNIHMQFYFLNVSSDIYHQQHSYAVRAQSEPLLQVGAALAKIWNKFAQIFLIYQCIFHHAICILIYHHTIFGIYYLTSSSHIIISQRQNM